MPFWRRRFSSSGSVVGGRQVLPEQTRALGLSLGRCGNVWRRATGKYSSEVVGVTRRTDLPKRKTSFAARSSFSAVALPCAPVMSTCVGCSAKRIAANAGAHHGRARQRHCGKTRTCRERRLPLRQIRPSRNAHNLARILTRSPAPHVAAPPQRQTQRPRLLRQHLPPSHHRPRRTEAPPPKRHRRHRRRLINAVGVILRLSDEDSRRTSALNFCTMYQLKSFGCRLCPARMRTYFDPINCPL